MQISKCRTVNTVPASSQISSRLVDKPERIALLGNMHLHSDGLLLARGEVSVKAAKTYFISDAAPSLVIPELRSTWTYLLRR